ncbi:MAG: Cof-type HAD-IIB family hydrolase [Muribaculaceae bacterium]|nr:Cof-type HAD-IIB family hydrolase [Muribaculaceae bacterium]
MKKTLYVSDMDGTLLGTDSMVSARSSRIITELSSEGALITVATARTPATVGPLLAGTLMLPPAVTMTGAALWHAGVYESVRFMPEGDVREGLRACVGCGIHPFVYTLGDDGVLDVYHAAGELNHAERKFYEERSSLPLKRFHLRRELPDEAAGRTILFCTLGETARIEAAAAQLREATECSVQNYPDIMMADTGILEVFAPGVSKAEAILRVKEATGAERIVAFGDNLNDLPMLAMADVAVAVENALPEVKAAADIVIGRNSSDAVALFIRDDFFGTAQR